MIGQKKHMKMMGMKQKTIRGKMKKNLKKRGLEMNNDGFSDEEEGKTNESYYSYYTNRSLSMCSESQVQIFMPDPDILLQFDNQEHIDNNTEMEELDRFRKSSDRRNIEYPESATHKLPTIQSRIKFAEVSEKEAKAMKLRKQSKAYMGVRGEKIPYVFICPTLYRETYEEMETLIVSLMRINRDQLTNPTQQYQFETNIFFDNCYQKGENGKRTLNEYVLWFTEIMMKVSDRVKFDQETIGCSNVSSFEKPDVTFWPYGIRLEYKFPYPEMSSDYNGEANRLFVHLKDPLKIQKGKRWSQSMYFYYLLGYKFGCSGSIDRSRYSALM